jgi:hypothetical protein
MRETTTTSERHNTVRCSCYISSMKRIIFEVESSEKSRDEGKGKRRAKLLAKRLLLLSVLGETLHSIDVAMECILMLLKKEQHTG